MTATHSTARPLVILGGGYTGTAVYNRLRRRGTRAVSVSSRIPGKHLLFADPSHRLTFDLAQPHSWDGIPAQADILWCFPAEPVEAVARFAMTSALAQRRVVVLGSTSAYELDRMNDYPPPWVDETAPVDLSKPRVRGEEYLRQECNAIVLRAAGIYGTGRNPLNWIRTGRVGPTRKYVNLIHVEDLAEACLAALQRGTPGETYNVSDGTPRTWEAICLEARQRWKVQPAVTGPAEPVGKRIANAKLVDTLGLELRHGELFEELDRLEKGPGT